LIHCSSHSSSSLPTFLKSRIIAPARRAFCTGSGFCSLAVVVSQAIVATSAFSSGMNESEEEFFKAKKKKTVPRASTF
jgi:hypothetical protein